MFYKEIVYQHFENPKNTQKINNVTHSAIIGNISIGAIVKIDVNIEKNIIKEIAFKAYGGGAMIACMSLLTEKVKGRNIAEALLITPENLSEALSLEPVKLIFAIIAIDTLHSVIDNTL